MKKILSLFIVTVLLFLAEPSQAALDTYSGSFLTGTTTGNASVTGVGFEPKIVIFYGAALPDPQGSYNGSRQGIGAAVSSSKQWATSIYHNWSSGSAVSQSSRQVISTKCFSYVTNTSVSNTTVTMDATFVSQDANGFTYNLTTTDGTARRIFFVALGGTDLSANVGTFNTGTSTGNVAVTGVGFTPSVILAVSSVSSTSDEAAMNASMSFGAANTSSSFSSFWTSINNQATKVVSGYQVANDFIARWFTTTPASPGMNANLVSMDSDGFTFNLSYTIDGISRKIGYIALNGIQTKIGSTLQKTTTGTVAVTGVGFTPKLLILSSVNATQTTSASLSAGLTIGAATSTSSRRVSCIDGINAVANNPMQGFTSESLVMAHCRGTETTADSTHPTVLGQADLSSFDSDGFTLNWTATNGTQIESKYIAIGENTTTSSGSTGVMYLF